MGRPLTISLILLIIIISLPFFVQPEDNVREAKYAGKFYPRFNLGKKVDSFLEDATTRNTRALIVPHAGYSYSGEVAGKGFSRINDDYDKIIIIGTNHNREASFEGISITNRSHYETPMGKVKVSHTAKKLRDKKLFTHERPAHESHIIEVELPFLQERLEKFEIIPMVTSRLSEKEIENAAETIGEYIDEDTLIVVSSDLSHYHGYDEAVNTDRACIDSILNQSSIECEACGIYAIKILNRISKEKGWTPELIDYRNSGDVTGNKDRVVGYSSITYYKETNYSRLKQVAREKLRTLYSDEEFNPGNIPGELNDRKGCFTTLYKKGKLRGCTGNILPEDPLHKCVIDNIENAAFNDKRFEPVREEELDEIDIEISILSEPKMINKHGKELVEHINKSHGVILKRGFHSATYLPSVWEKIDDEETFLSRLCTKGNMEEDCWKDKNTEVYIYTTKTI